MIEITIAGEPKAQARPRFRFRGKGVYSPKTDWYKTVYADLVKHYPNLTLVGPLHMDIIFNMPKPKTLKRLYPDVRPDLDNLAKAVMDACNQAKIWHDDSQVIALTLVKMYSNTPGAKITINMIGGAI